MGSDSFWIASRQREQHIPRYARDDSVLLKIDRKLSQYEKMLPRYDLDGLVLSSGT